MTTMNLTELSELLGQATDVLRVETLDEYRSASDGDMLNRYLHGDPKPDPSEKQPWLDRLAAAADRGHPWKRLRLVSRPVPTYVRYACEFGYVDNVSAGEDVRVWDAGITRHGNGDQLKNHFGDWLVVDEKVVKMHYDESGAFCCAHGPYGPGDGDWYLLKGLAEPMFTMATSFTEWWAVNPDLHRMVPAA